MTILNGIPIEWRLTEEEEYRILSVMEREEIELPKILKIRMELLLAESHSAEVEFIPQEISLVPKAFQKVIPPSEWKKVKHLESWQDLPYGERAFKKNKEKWVAYLNQVSETYCKHFFP